MLKFCMEEFSSNDMFRVLTERFKLFNIIWKNIILLNKAKYFVSTIFFVWVEIHGVLMQIIIYFVKIVFFTLKARYFIPVVFYVKRL